MNVCLAFRALMENSMIGRKMHCASMEEIRIEPCVFHHTSKVSVFSLDFDLAILLGTLKQNSTNFAHLQR